MRMLGFIAVINSINWYYDTNKSGASSGNDLSKDDELLKTVTEYCKAKYKFFRKKSNHKLEKLIVVFRHGDRSPLHKLNEKWSKKKCIKCESSSNTISMCKRTKCIEGDLTVKGYSQAKQLGKHILKYYKPLLFDDKVDEKDIGFRATSVGRTHSTLMGVMNGLNGNKELKDVNIVKDNDSLLRPKGCEFLEKNMSIPIKIPPDLEKKLEKMSKNSIRKISEEADNAKCSFCNGIDIKCEDDECDSSVYKEIIKLTNNIWIGQMKKISDSEKGKRVIFGRFAGELLKLFDSEKTLNLISAHDGTLSMILSSISSEIQQWPPYLSAIFFEVWCKSGSQFVRIVFNDKIVKFDDNQEDHIPINDFTNFLKRVNADEGEQKSLCASSDGDNGSKSNEQNLLGKNLDVLDKNSLNSSKTKNFVQDLMLNNLLSDRKPYDNCLKDKDNFVNKLLPIFTIS